MTINVNLADYYRDAVQLQAFCRTALIAATGLLVLGCEPVPESTPLPRPVRAVQVESGDSLAPAGFNAQVVSQQKISVAFEVSGRVAQRHVNNGDRVESDQSLISLIETDLALQVGRFQAQIKVAEAEMRTAKTDLERFQSLQGQQFVSPTDLDQAGNRYSASVGRLETVAAELALAKRQLGYATVRASFSGWINELVVDPGQVVVAGEPLALLESTALEVAFALPEQHLTTVHVGDKLQATFWACDACATETVVSEVGASAVGTTGMVPVRALLKNADAQLRPGMSAWVAMQRSWPATTTVIPQIAVIQHKGGPAVWTVISVGDDQSLKLKSVVLGELVGDLVLVTQGLASDDWVVTAGQQLLTQQQSVRLVE